MDKLVTFTELVRHVNRTFSLRCVAMIGSVRLEVVTPVPADHPLLQALNEFDEKAQQRQDTR